MAQVTPTEETTPLIMAERPSANKGSCFTVLREEFRLKNFGFNFENPGVFIKSQWKWPRFVFVTFRLCLAIYTSTICLLSLVYFPRKNPHRPWPVWLTNWSYLLLTCHEVCAATIAVVHLNDGRKGCCVRDDVSDDDDDDDDVTNSGDVIRRRGTDGVKSLPCYMKLDWLLFCVSAPVAMSITMGILTAGVQGVGVKDFNNHIMNGVVALLDYCVGAIPVRLFHFVYIVIYYTIYHLFSYIFWSFDHTGNVLYVNMDWEDPGSVVIGWVFIALVMGGIMQIFTFALYRLRLFVYSKIYKHEERNYEQID